MFPASIRKMSINDIKPIETQENKPVSLKEYKLFDENDKYCGTIILNSLEHPPIIDNKKKKKEPKTEKLGPKRPANAFQLYYHDMIETVKKDPKYIESITNGEKHHVMKHAAELWKNETEQVKKTYADRYKSAIDEYKKSKTPEKKEPTVINIVDESDF